ncbi:MAG: GIY-YIG nuclease family protein [Campylobacterales bacterium]|nr:GIY-YIG nuclease family protein [Campylobacterales bacterium]
MDKISKTNIKSIVEFYNKQIKLFNKNDIPNKQQSLFDKQIFQHYDPTPGYVYCMKNIIFNFYGDNLFKIGNSLDCDKRLIQYTSSYPEPSEFVVISELLFDKSFAELLLFHYLKSYLFKPDREFFKCELKIIQQAIHKVGEFFKTYHNKNLLLDFFIKEGNIYDYYRHNNSAFVQKNVTDKKNLLIDNIISTLSIKSNDFSDEQIFTLTLTKHLLSLNFDKFYHVYNNHYHVFDKYQIILDRIDVLFWFENIINIQRFNFNDICSDLNFVKTTCFNNIDKFFIIFNDGHGTKYINNRINNTIKKIITVNKLQKFYADILNFIQNNAVTIRSKCKRINNVQLLFYHFDIN